MKIRLLDIVAVLFVLMLSLLCALPLFKDEKSEVLTVTTDSGTYTISLDTDSIHEIVSNSHKLTLTVEGGKAKITEYTCPDGLCSFTGWLSETGQTAVCLPAKVSVRVGGENEVLDGIVG